MKKEDLALTLNGKKRNLKLNYFTTAFNTSILDPKQQENIFRKMKSAKSKWMDFIEISFLSNDFKKAYKEIIEKRFSVLNLK